MFDIVCHTSVEIANRGADEFLRVYYATYDSARRAEGVPKFYRETSYLTYNGTSVTGPDAIKELLERLPVTKHEVQSYDCHPIASERVTWPHLRELVQMPSYSDITTSIVDHRVRTGNPWARGQHGGDEDCAFEPDRRCTATSVLSDIRAYEEGEIFCIGRSLSFCRLR